MSLETTPIDQIPKIVSSLRQSFQTGKTKDVQYRKAQLKRFYEFLVKEKDGIEKALFKDLHKSGIESQIMEVAILIGEISSALGSIDSWVLPTIPPVPILNAMDGCQIRYDPLGVVLIISAWNYPIQLSLSPLIGAIAAGNCAILKPSEISPHTAQFLGEYLPKYLDPECFAVVNGGVPETSKLLEERFDHILYTGNSQVGKIVMAAASKHLTPVTLELGGKSPVVILDDADPVVAARRITWGRFANCGQTCIAPDYILCTKAMQEKLVPQIALALKEYYGENPQKSNDYGRIVNRNHFKRVSGLIEADKVAFGGQTDENDLYIAPTVLVEVNEKSPSMQQEIFGPVLPILNISNLDEALAFINQREKPLALYVFGKNQTQIEKVLSNTSSGGALVNDCLMHLTVETLPFGGVGYSGMGAYHGHHTFLLFSHKKSVMKKDEGMEFVNSLRYPPYTAKKFNVLSNVLFKKPSESGLSFSSGVGVIGAAAAIVSYFL